MHLCGSAIWTPTEELWTLRVAPYKGNTHTDTARTLTQSFSQIQRWIFLPEIFTSDRIKQIHVKLNKYQQVESFSSLLFRFVQFLYRRLPVPINLKTCKYPVLLFIENSITCKDAFSYNILLWQILIGPAIFYCGKLQFFISLTNSVGWNSVQLWRSVLVAGMFYSGNIVWLQCRCIHDLLW